MQRRDYKAHVEGLRAFAVVPILLFHLDANWCPGGFIGVDVFFVISGYLITGLILSEGTEFAFARFYVRRVFRLLPALVATLVMTLVAGWYVLPPADYVRLALSALSALAAVSNIYFLTTVDYFNASSLLHPLLHTWSLGVEEQFYLVWPALIVLWLRRSWPPWTLIVGGTVVSFTAMIAFQSTEPDAVFYLMPFRMFELGLGASLLLCERRKPSGPIVGTAFSLLGAGLLLASLTLIDSSVPWPSLWSLLPCIATVLLIAFGASGPIGKVLEFSVTRFLGRISYSVYLVHWPLVTLYRAYIIIEPTPLELVGLGLVAIALGAVLFATVETRFRQSRPTETQRTAPGARAYLGIVPGWKTSLLGAQVAVLLSASAAIIASSGFASRLDRSRIQNADGGLPFAGDQCSFRRSRCVFGDPEAASVVQLVGDSLALNWVHGLDHLFREQRIKGIALYDHGCLHVYDTKRFNNGRADERCGKNVEEAYAAMARNRWPVILAGDWGSYINNIGPLRGSEPLRQDEEQYFGFLEQRLIEGLERIGAGDRTIILVKQQYATGINIAQCMLQPGLAESARASLCSPQSRSAAIKGAAAADRMLERVAKRFTSVVLLDPKLQFCPEERCVVSDERGLYFRDTSHLTSSGSLFMVGQLRAVLLRVLGEEQNQKKPN